MSDAEPVPPHRAYLYFEVDEQGRMLVDCGWPSSHDDDVTATQVMHMAALAHEVGSGRAMTAIREAVARVGEEHDARDEAAMVLYSLDELALCRTEAPGKGAPIVPPRRAFSR